MLCLVGFTLTAAPSENKPSDSSLTPEQSLQKITLPEGFKATLFAAEPAIRKPIAMTFDDRGRLWVVESASYPHWLPADKTGKDRIIILEDRAGKGSFDTRTVFLDNGTNLSGIAVGFGGVWLAASPNLLFIPVKPGEDHPAGPPQILLDGWSLQAKHNVFNSLTWGVDGWLYGCNGIVATSRLGKPGTPDEQRIPMNCGVWRYHPTRHVFEPFAWGTTNPWGLDFNELGEMFITNCVIKHIFHVVPGAHFQRMYGQDLNPNVYELMESCADHLHWAGGDWTTSRGAVGAHSDAGGGHAHSGAMVYLGDNWPKEYRGKIFMGNIHGARLNMDILKPQGSGYVSSHGTDMMFGHDSWYRPLIVQYGPDGGVYVADWHDTGECHNYNETQPLGRIFKVVHGRVQPLKFNLAERSDAELIQMQKHVNEWFARHARRLLQERAAAGTLEKTSRAALREELERPDSVEQRLRLLWTLHAVEGLDEKTLLALLSDTEPTLRSWAVRLLVDQRSARDTTIARLTQLARSEVSPRVRLALASALQWIAPPQRWELGRALAAHGEDATDANLPLMIWYGLEPLASIDGAKTLNLLKEVRIPLVRQFLVRRLAELSGNDQPVNEGLIALLTSLSDGELTRDILRGIHDSVQRRGRSVAPPGWAAVASRLQGSKDVEIVHKVLLLGFLFGDAPSRQKLMDQVLDSTIPLVQRQETLQALVESRRGDGEGLGLLLRRALREPQIRRAALRALASLRDPETPALILEQYPQLGEDEKTDALATLTGRPEYALALMDAIEKNRLPARDLSPFLVRQMLALNNNPLKERITRVWGSIRPADLSQLPRYQALVPPDALKQADRSNGRGLFRKNCATCHRLFDEGGKIGPELTGSQRRNPDYLLTKLLAPNAVVARDYLMTIITTRDGRTVAGLVKEENDRTLLLQTATQEVRLQKSDIEERTRSNQSLMPEGMLEKLNPQEIRDLIGYLAGPDQVPLPR